MRNRGKKKEEWDYAFTKARLTAFSNDATSFTSINKTDYIYIIISDGITEASEQHLNMLRRFAPRVKLILVDYSFEPNYNWVQLLKQYNNVMLVNDVASFENAVKRALVNA